MRLQIASQLAIYALLELAADPERQLSVGEIGGKYGISNHHLAKVMNVLGRAKLVRSVRGVGGGYHFSGNARRMTLLDVVELFEDLGAGSSEGHAAGVPGKTTDEGRALAGVLQEIDEIARATLGSITIATMLKIVQRQKAGAPARATVIAGRR